MDKDTILEFVKYNLGLNTTVRDKYLSQIIEGAIAELKNSGINPDGQDESYIKEYETYLIDYSSWLYRNRGGETSLPRHLIFKRRNLQIGHKDVG